MLGKKEPVNPELITKWDDTTTALNKLTQEHQKDPAKLLGKMNEYSAGTDEQKLIYAAFKFREEVLDNLVTIGHEITVNSTGVKGLKWGEGLGENRIPANFLPSHIQTEDENGNTVFVPLVNYDKDGKAEGLTEHGMQLLDRYSANRAS